MKLKRRISPPNQGIEMKILAASIVCLVAASPAWAQAYESQPSIADFGFLIGDWEGQSTFLYPREEGREQSQETVSTTCKYVLKETYIQCDTAWTNAEDRTRTFRLHFNYNQLDEGYQVLFVYDNWPRHVSYLLHYDDKAGAYIGLSDFEDSDGVSGQERVEWRVSDDKRELRSSEFNHLETDPDGYWANYFEFVWRKAN